jgi:hypothetical protein
MNLLSFIGIGKKCFYQSRVPMSFATKRLLPDNAIATLAFSPLMELELIVAPVVALYSLTDEM